MIYDWFSVKTAWRKLAAISSDNNQSKTSRPPTNNRRLLRVTHDAHNRLRNLEIENEMSEHNSRRMTMIGFDTTCNTIVQQLLHIVKNVLS